MEPTTMGLMAIGSLMGGGKSGGSTKVNVSTPVSSTQELTFLPTINVMAQSPAGSTPTTPTSYSSPSSYAVSVPMQADQKEPYQFQPLSWLQGPPVTDVSTQYAGKPAVTQESGGFDTSMLLLLAGIGVVAYMVIK